MVEEIAISPNLANRIKDGNHQSENMFWLLVLVFLISLIFLSVRRFSAFTIVFLLNSDSLLSSQFCFNTTFFIYYSILLIIYKFTVNFLQMEPTKALAKSERPHETKSLQSTALMDRTRFVSLKRQQHTNKRVKNFM